MMALDANTFSGAIPVQTREMLEKSLSHPHPVIRAKGVEAAARVGSPAIVPLLSPLWNDPDTRVRKAAIEAFAACADASQGTLLRQFFSNADGDAIAAFIAALRRRETAAELWAEVLHPGYPQPLRLAAIQALDTASAPAASGALIRAAVDEDDAIRAAVEPVLLRTPVVLRGEAASATLADLEAAKRSGSPQAQRAAQMWIDRIRAAQLRRTLAESGTGTAMALSAALRSESALIRRAAAETCGVLGAAAGIPPLVQALNDSDAMVRRLAAISLAQLQWRPDTAPHYAAQLVALGRFKAAADLGPVGVEGLIDALPGLTPADQVKAIEILGTTQSLRAMNVIAELLDHPALQVRQAAARSLKRLEWVPPNDAAGLQQALVLEDWAAAAQRGAVAVAPLLSALKEAREDAVKTAEITAALLQVRDAAAVHPLVEATRDGEVASTAIAALEELLTHTSDALPLELLESLSRVDDPVQFSFAFDASYGRHVRSGLDVVSAAGLRERAKTVLTRRVEVPS